VEMGPHKRPESNFNACHSLCGLQRCEESRGFSATDNSRIFIGRFALALLLTVFHCYAINASRCRRGKSKSYQENALIT